MMVGGLESVHTKTLASRLESAHTMTLACKSLGFHGMTMENAIFWDMMLCGSCRNRHSGGLNTQCWSWS
jgi:hypothetical protein